ncbi:hypothetical protein [Streptomyces avicenniae]|uniref:hypothetical protein n=1 Tax=Streptomyces avicenniae TaxID=500153 RepID=UPI000699803D|nr:hypothetical protein [Streptomyces avicenniae]
MTFDPPTASAPSQHDLAVDTASLNGFHTWMSDSLGGIRSDGITPALADELVAMPEQFGAPGLVPTDFATRYDAMRTRLADFIQFQQEAAEALGIIARLSGRNFEALEADHLARLRVITDSWHERALVRNSGGGGGGGTGDMML